MTDVFVSYCRRNKAFVQKLYERLIQDQRQVWVDWENIPPNADWRAEIADGIETTNTVLFVLSPPWLASNECRLELEQALKHHKRLLPILHEEVQYQEVHPSLASLNWIFFRETDDFEQAYQSLHKALNSDLQYIKTHTRLLTKAVEWDKKDRDPSFLLRGKDFLDAEQWLKQAATQSPASTSLHTDYIISSGQNQSKRQKTTLIGVGAGLVMACGLAIAAFAQYRIAETQRQRAEELQTITLSETAEATFASRDELGGLLASVKANTRLRDLLWLTPEDPIYHQAEENLRQLYEMIHEKNRLEGHHDLVTNVRVSSDGQTIASTSADNTVKLWSRDGRLLTTLEGHTSTVWAVMFSPDNKMVASTSEDRTVRLWSLDGTLLKTIALDSPVWSVSFSPTENVLAIATADRTIQLVKTDGTEVRRWQGPLLGKIFSIRFSPDGQTILTGSGDKVARLWSLQGELLQTFEGHTGEVWAVRFSPDGKQVATASADNRIKLWSLDGQLIRTLEGHQSGVISIAYSADGQRLVSGSADHTVRVWNIQGVLLNTFAHSDIVAGVDFLDKDMVVSGSYDRTVRVWWLDSELHQNLDSHQRRILSLAVSQDPVLIASSSTDTTVKLWHQEGDRYTLLRSLTLPQGEPNSISLDRQGGLLAVGSSTGQIYLWNQEGELIRTIPGDGLELWSISVSPDGQVIAAGGTNNQIQLWSRDGQLLHTLLGHQEAVRSLAFSPDGEFIASGGMDNKVKIWSRDGQLLHTLEGHEASVFSVAFSPDSQMVVSGSMDNTIKLWRVDGTLIRSFIAHNSGVTSVSFSPDGERIASGSFDNLVKLWSLEGTLMRTLVGHQQRIAALTFSPDGKFLISGAADKLVKLWDVTHLVSPAFTRDQLTEESCKWLTDYLHSNPRLSESDRQVCS